MTGRKLRCAGPAAGPVCDAYLGEIDRGKVKIYCRRCKNFHMLEVSDLVQETLDWLNSVQPVIENQFLERLAEKQRPMVAGKRSIMTDA